jgi:hypothetical protein
MLAMEIWNEAGELEANALRRPSWANPTRTPTRPTRRLSRVRRTVGRALIGLGRAIVAEPNHVGRVVSPSRQ